MIHVLFRGAIALTANAVALLFAARWIPGVTLAGTPYEILLVAFLLTALNYTLKPILKLLFGPLVLITFGLALVLVNAVILAFLDFITPTLMIEGISALLLATLGISLVNVALHPLLKLV